MSDEGKLFIGGLSFDTNKDVLKLAFDKYGVIEKCDVIMDRETGKSRGFGFVKFENPEDAKDAMDGMDGTELDGRQIRVDEAGKGKSNSRGRGSCGYRSGRDGRGDSGWNEWSRGSGQRNYGGGGPNYGGGQNCGGGQNYSGGQNCSGGWGGRGGRRYNE